MPTGFFLSIAKDDLMSLFATMQELVKSIPDSNDLLMKVAGTVGGGVFASGFFVDPSWMSATGQLLGGTAALMTILFTLYKAYKNRAKVPKP